MKDTKATRDQFAMLQNKARKVFDPANLPPEKVSTADMQKLVSELQIHQVELEMQNEELRKTQVELEASRSKFSDLYDFAPIGYVTLDRKGEILEANLTAAKQLSKDRSQLISASFYGHIDRADRDVFYLHLKKVFQEKTQQVCEVRIKEKSDIDIFSQLDSIIVEDSKGNPTCRTSLTDITWRKQAEEEKEDLQAQLLQARKMEAIGRLVGGIAHDFNNLMTLVNDVSQDILSGLGPGHPLREELEWIKTAGQRASALTQQLLAFGSKQTLHHQVLNLNKVVGQMEKMLSRLIGEHLELTTLLGTGLPSVKADWSKIELVIMNLTINAKDAMPDGGRLTIRTGNFTLDKPVSKTFPEAKPGRYVYLSIEDTGAGMDEATLEKVFEPFFTTKNRGLGTGLGLSTVYGIIVQHGGWIDVRSRLEKGTTFAVYLPAVAGEEEEDRQAIERPQHLAGNGERILLVEDEAIIRMFCSKMLRERGYEVVEAKNAEEALKVFMGQERKFDMLISDVVLPGMNGPQMADQLLNSNSDLKVLLISGYPDSEQIWPGRDKSAFGFIQKPFDVGDFLQTIKRILETR